MKYECIVVAEDEYEGKYGFSTKIELEAFIKGAIIGANLYGCGNFGVYTHDDIGDEDIPEGVDDLIRKHLGEK